jgi:membrane-associated protease RseP (regulator of RpoE activity)
MTGWNKTISIWLVALAAAPALAQQDSVESGRSDAGDNGVSAEAIEVQMREAEERLADAAARVAELSSRRLPVVLDIEQHMRGFDRPVLGVTIGVGEEEGPVEGVTIQGVTPGSAAAEAGLRAGDIITAVNGEALGAETDSQANRKLLDFMEGIENGDELDIEYLRDGKEATVTVEPRPGTAFPLAFRNNGNWNLPIAPGAPGNRWFGFYLDGGGWGDMEMVSLTEDLGRYFGTDSGLLVVRAPSDEALQLKDGDVIQRIDGREPTSVSHAMRILGSYQGGEKLEIEIMRDKKRQTLSVEMPDHRQGALRGFGPPMPPVKVQSIAPRISAGTEEDRIGLQR